MTMYFLQGFKYGHQTLYHFSIKMVQYWYWCWWCVLKQKSFKKIEKLLVCIGMVDMHWYILFFIGTAWYHYGIDTNDMYWNKQLPRLVQYNQCTPIGTKTNRHGQHVAVRSVLVCLALVLVPISHRNGRVPAYHLFWQFLKPWFLVFSIKWCDLMIVFGLPWVYYRLFSLELEVLNRLIL